MKDIEIDENLKFFINDEQPIFWTYDKSLRLYMYSSKFLLVRRGYKTAKIIDDRLSAFESISDHLRKEYDVFKEMLEDICNEHDERHATVEAIKKNIGWDVPYA